jgi:ribokinase
VTVHVVGNAVVDTAYRLPHLPTPGETVLATDTRVDWGGKGLNQAVAAAVAGAPVTFAAAVGEDSAGEGIAEVLARHPRLSQRLWRRRLPTDRSIVLVDARGENAIVSTAFCAASVTPAEVETALADAAPGDLAVLQGNLSPDATAAALAAGKRRGALTLLNPAPLAFPVAPLLPLVDILVANAVEAAALGIDAEAGLAGTAVVVTLGAAGCVGRAAGAGFRIAAPTVEAVDTAGAGDAFVGTLAAALHAGAPMPRAAELATAAGSLVVTRPGTYAAIAALGALPAR